MNEAETVVSNSFFDLYLRTCLHLPLPLNT